MASKPGNDTSAARSKLTAQMLKLEEKIDRLGPGSPERLALLRQQATLSDKREALISDRL